MERIKSEDTGLIYLVDIKKIIMARQNNRPFTNSLYRHLKRNMIAILDNPKKDEKLFSTLIGSPHISISFGLPPKYRSKKDTIIK